MFLRVFYVDIRVMGRETFGANLRSAMKSAGLTAKDLAQRLLVEGHEISYRTIEGWKDSRGSMPGADVAVGAAKILGVSVEYLVTGQDCGDAWVREHATFIAACKELDAAGAFGPVVVGRAFLGRRYSMRAWTARRAAGAVLGHAIEARNSGGAARRERRDHAEQTSGGRPVAGRRVISHSPGRPGRAWTVKGSGVLLIFCTPFVHQSPTAFS